MAGAVALSGGEAKAYVNWALTTPLSYQTFDAHTPPDGTDSSGAFDPDWSPWVGDKRIKILNGGTVAGMSVFTNDVEWGYKPTSPLPWHVDLDQQGNINSASSFMYRLQIDPTKDGLNICSTYATCQPYMGQVQFGIQANNPAVPVKSIYQAIGDTKGPLLLTLQSGETKSIPGDATDIIVDITWPANQAVADINDNYKQVPAPLPLLGAGAAFGMLRRMRQVSSLRKTLSPDAASARAT